MVGTRKFNSHSKSFKGGLDHSLQICEGLSLGDGYKPLCLHQGAELRLRVGRDWPKMRKNSNITIMYKDHCKRYIRASRISPTVKQVRRMIFIL